jgi:uncharacterized membrane protein YdbT with pleckstrin-like domain
VAEHVVLDARRHGIVLVRPLSRAFALAAVGGVGLVLGWPASLPGAVLLVVAACLAVASVWRWDRTHVVLTDAKLTIVAGRRTAFVPLERIRAVEVEQSLLGRLLGYGTIVAGDLEIECVREPRRLAGFL